MSNKKSSTSFLVQGSILAMASIISRIIGLVYRIPLTAIIGNKGNDYYGCAFEIYNILLIISSYSLPLAVSKLVSADMSLGRKKNVYRILKCALIFGLVSGTIAALILFFGAEFITGPLPPPPPRPPAPALGTYSPVISPHTLSIGGPPCGSADLWG